MQAQKIRLWSLFQLRKGASQWWNAAGKDSCCGDFHIRKLGAIGTIKAGYCAARKRTGGNCILTEKAWIQGDRSQQQQIVGHHYQPSRDR